MTRHPLLAAWLLLAACSPCGQAFTVTGAPVLDDAGYFAPSYCESVCAGGQRCGVSADGGGQCYGPCK